MDFKVGDVVQLKSGGLSMTVETVLSHNLIYCVWFDDDNQLQRDEFNAKVLVSFPVPEPRGGDAQ